MGTSHSDVTPGISYGRLTIVREVASRVSRSGRRRRYVKCKCDCGATAIIRVDAICGGHTSSCGCLQKEAAARTGQGSSTHHMSATQTYQAWTRMKQRCFNHAHTQYHHYGGRGITVCARWLVFETFFHDMGVCPPQHSLDRIDNDGPYSPDNCRWATQKEQMRNTRSNHMLVIDGTTLCLAEWAELAGVSADCIRGRLRLGWTPQEAIHGRRGRSDSQLDFGLRKHACTLNSGVTK